MGGRAGRKDESLLTLQRTSQVQIVTPHMQNDEPGHMSLRDEAIIEMFVLRYAFSEEIIIQAA